MINKNTEHHNKFNRFDDQNDFVVRPLKKMRLIESYNGLDDECEFEKNMFNFGDFEDLPPSDRSVDNRCKPD